MKRHAPDVREYMTRLPVEAERCETVADAIAMMESNQIDHIPVMNGSHIKGVVSMPDILSARARWPDRGDNVRLDEICQADVLKVSPVTSIDEVARELLQRDADNAVVMDGGFVVGIFTTTDVLRFICDFFGQTNGPSL